MRTHDPRTLLRRPGRLLGALTLGAALTLTACGADETDPGATTSQDEQADHNKTDVAFASDMIPHHAQALEMVEMTEGRTLDPEVRQLTDDIRAAQAPEIELMSGWLKDWDEEVPDSMSGHDMGDHDGMGDDDMGGDDDSDRQMPGMMSDDDMRGLDHARGADFQTMWLRMMIRHHEGAVEMARTEQADGTFDPAIELAGDIVKSQTAEIEKMKSLLDS